MDVVTLILRILILIAGIVVIVTVTMQSGKNEGASAGIMGGGSSDSYFGRNKGKTLEGRLAMLTKVSIGALVALSIAVAILQKVLG